LSGRKKSNGFESSLFQLIRLVWLVGAALLVVVLIVTLIAFILTFQPDKPVKIRSVNYDEIAFVIQKTHIPAENDIAAGASLPTSVANFLANHQGIDFKELMSEFNAVTDEPAREDARSSKRKNSFPKAVRVFRVVRGLIFDSVAA
jgi:hypothetical protein